MNKRNTKFFLNVVISKFNTVYDYRMFLVKNFGIEDVKNELDVVAVKDSILICISCKDSKKYD